MYVKVPAEEGVPIIGSRFLYFGVSISPTEAVCHINDGTLEEGWIELTEQEFRQYVPEPEPALPAPTEQEIVNAELLLGQALLAESQAAIEETAALILLETVGGGA